jgi:hypothetical protein
MGQGSIYSPPAWAQIVSKCFDAHGKRAHGATYCSPDGSITICLHMLVFVDDTKHHVNDMMSPDSRLDDGPRLPALERLADRIRRRPRTLQDVLLHQFLEI